MEVIPLNDFNILDFARKGLETEAEAILTASRRIGPKFVKAVELVAGCKGKVVVTGVGKSGIIGHKIASTLACSNIPALFMLASEALHGDLGVLTADDVVIAISNSGNNDEFKRGLLDACKEIGVKIIGFTSKPESILGSKADVVLDIQVEKEICPLGISATSSTTLTLALGDALAMAAMRVKGTSLKQFAFLHQGGAVGHELKSQN